MNWEPGIVIASRLRLVRLLGEGGMGSVWVAEHPGFSSVTLKL